MPSVSASLSVAFARTQVQMHGRWCGSRPSVQQPGFRPDAVRLRAPPTELRIQPDSCRAKQRRTTDRRSAAGDRPGHRRQSAASSRASVGGRPRVGPPAAASRRGGRRGAWHHGHPARGDGASTVSLRIQWHGAHGRSPSERHSVRHAGTS
jgi:hypothetical protein